MRFTPRVLLLVALAFLLSVSAFAQGTTGSLTGAVMIDGKGMPGVTVTITSPSLQGTRTAVTGESGSYNFPSLPPGRYNVKFELEGMTTVNKTSEINLAQTSRVDADLKVSTINEAITVTATAPSVLETSQVSTNLDRELIESLPVGRTIAARIQLAPGVVSNGPNNQNVINGAQSFDNLYLVNGVVVNENVRGQPQAVFIEDAIQETTLLTGGVSAEYGRFTGGVVSTITKSGGNEFSGSLRANLRNDSWTKLTDFRDPITGKGQAKAVDKINPVYEETLGGRIIRDRLWFFLAGRQENRESSFQTTGTNIPYVNTVEDKRYEAKLTANFFQNHSIVGSYTDNSTKETNNRFGSIVDLASLSNRELPLSLISAHYNGVITKNFLAEAQYSQKDFAFVGGGAMSRDLIYGTLLRDRDTARRAWSPTFCGVCPDKERNNKDYTIKGSYFLSSRAMGSHSFVGGYDDFHELRTEDNYQSGSDFRLFGYFIYDDPRGINIRVLPSTAPGKADRSYFEWDPITQSSKTSDFATKSLFINDKWDFNNHLSFNLGVRYDKNDGKNQAGTKTTDDARTSPRLGVVYDIAGNGRHRLSANYGRYVAKIDQGPADTTSPAGRPSYYYYEYLGPAINPAGTPTAQLLPTAEVIRQAFDWFKANGFTNNNSLLFGLGVPGLTERFDDTLRSPYMDEMTIGYGTQIGSNGYLRADYINRDWSDFYVIRRNTSTGKNTTPAGKQVDVGVIENSSSDLSREYNGIQLQGSYRFFGRLTTGGNYTYSKLEGNVEGETFNNATVFVGAEEYPEYKAFAEHQPEGYLNADIRHRANIWLQLDTPVPFGNLNISLLERYHSGVPYSAVSTIDVRPYVTNPGYSTPPSSVNYYFTDRGEFRLDNISSTDLNVNYSFPISKLNVFLKADLLNAFNQQGVEYAATSLGNVVEQRVYTARNSQTFCKNDAGAAARCTAFNPFNTAPVEGKNWAKDPNFGKPTNAEAYQLPRTYRFAVGLRF